jgi:hypothetical protein
MAVPVKQYSQNGAKRKEEEIGGPDLETPLQQKPGHVDFPECQELFGQQSPDKETGNDEKEVDSQHSIGQPVMKMVKYDGNDRYGPENIEGGYPVR